MASAGKRMKKISFTPENVRRAVAREKGCPEQALEVTDVSNTSIEVSTRETVDGREVVCWEVLASDAVERAICEDVVVGYVEEGINTLLGEFEPEVVVRALYRAANLPNFRRWLRSVLKSEGFKESTVRAAMADPAEYARLMFVREGSDDVAEMLFDGLIFNVRRLARILLEEGGGIDGFNHNELVHTPEGFVIEGQQGG